MANELEASKAAAVRSVGELQQRLAAEHKQMLKLQVGATAGGAFHGRQSQPIWTAFNGN